MGSIGILSGERERVSLIATIFNEADSIETWLRSVSGQTRQPDELVLVDAGSTDGTVETIRSHTSASFPIHLHVVEGANVPEGRNSAFRYALGPIVAVTDAGTDLDPSWLER